MVQFNYLTAMSLVAVSTNYISDDDDEEDIDDSLSVGTSISMSSTFNDDIFSSDENDVGCTGIYKTKKKKRKKNGFENTSLNELVSKSSPRANFKFQKLMNISDAELLINDYSCALQRDILIHGRMYLSSNWICFHANIFGWKKQVTIQWTDVVSIEKRKTMKVIPNAIKISTVTEDYLFCSFVARDRAFKAFNHIWGNAIREKPVDSVTLKKSCMAFRIKNPNTLSRSQNQDKDDDEYYSANEYLDAVVEIENQKSNGDFEFEEEVVCPCINDHTGTEYINEEFNYDVDTLYEHLFSQNSDLMIDVFAKMKFENVMYTPYSRDTDRSYYQVLSYHVPIPYNIGKKCYTESTQIMDQRNLPGSCYIIKTNNKSFNIPYGDNFIVHTQYCLTRASGNRSNLRVSMEIKFFKTLFYFVKNMIVSKAETAVKDFMNCLAKFLRKESDLEECKRIQKKALQKCKEIRSITEEYGSARKSSEDSLVLKNPIKLKTADSTNSKFKLKANSSQCRISFEALIIFLFCTVIILNIFLMHRIHNLEHANSLKEATTV